MARLRLSRRQRTQNNSRTKYGIPIPFIIIFGVIGIVLVFQASAAPKPKRPATTTPAVTLSITPSSQTIQNAQTVGLEIKLNTNGQPVNAVEAVVTYPADKFDFVSVDTAGSAFDLEAPINSAVGSVTISRAAITPVNLSDVHFATVNLRAKASGRKIPVNISDASLVIRSDNNQDILGRVTGGVYTIR